MTTIKFTKEQLFADLKKDGITAVKINNAKNEDGGAMNNIGFEYQHEKKKYDKAMAWYRLAAVKNISAAQNNIGVLYKNGEGVPQDYLFAMEWFLKAAIQNNKYAWGHIGTLFESGYGVPVNKYKALEWYIKSVNKQDRAKELTNQGIQLTQQDKNKTIEQLIMETEDIFWEARKKSEEEINTLKQFIVFLLQKQTN